MTSLCTRRLLLRELRQADLPAVARLLQNETAMYAYKHAFTDADVQAWLDRQRRRYAAHGFGLWVAQWESAPAEERSSAPQAA